MQKLLVFFFAFHTLFSFGQSLTREVLNISEGKISIPLDQHISGVCIETSSSTTLKSLSLFIDGRPIDILENPHFEGFQSQIITTDSNKELIIHSSTSHEIILIVIRAPSSPLQVPLRKTSSSCEVPSSIPQSMWRNTPTVLPAPTVAPTETEVNHVIVHHSAGSNLASDYTAEVRNIYTLHTQSNGWDDIGYNYLIAPNGTLFLGRDPQGLMDQDNVRGAHMCNKNNNTMAVCLLGNYEEVAPSDTMISTLYHLLAWKLTKEILPPFGSALHGIGPNSANNPDALLGHIAGHRDGCSPGYTVCPGQHVYEKLDSIRSLTESKMNNSCPVGIFESETNAGLPTIWKQGSVFDEQNAEHYDEVQFIDLQGKKLTVSWGQSLLLPVGHYLLRALSPSGIRQQRIAVIP